jgi:hypothetical protein
LAVWRHLDGSEGDAFGDQRLALIAQRGAGEAHAHAALEGNVVPGAFRGEVVFQRPADFDQLVERLHLQLIHRKLAPEAHGALGQGFNFQEQWHGNGWAAARLARSI